MTRSPAIDDLPGLGPASRGLLADAGIETVDQLRSIGSVAAFSRVRLANPRASLNLLWALEAALTDRRWQDVSRSERTRLLLSLDLEDQAMESNRDGARE